MSIPRLLLVLAILATPGCASQQEITRLQTELVDLQQQLAREKQRLKTIQATGKDSPVPQ